MIAVIFEVFPAEGRKDEYLDIAASMRPLVHKIEGFVSVERFQSLTDPAKLLSISWFENEEALDSWRELTAHRTAQAKGRAGIFTDYRIRIAHVMRDYGMTERAEAPSDSKRAHGA